MDVLDLLIGPSPAVTGAGGEGELHRAALFLSLSLSGLEFQNETMWWTGPAFFFPSVSPLKKETNGLSFFLRLT